MHLRNHVYGGTQTFITAILFIFFNVGTVWHILHPGMCFAFYAHSGSFKNSHTIFIADASPEVENHCKTVCCTDLWKKVSTLK